MVGESVGHYHVLGQLGAGGMGVVYEAVDQRLGRRVAIKFLPSQSAADGAARDRFLLEARTASALNHPGICTVHDVGEHEGRPYIVMERLEGCSLRQRLAEGPLPCEEVVELAAGVLDALSAAHRAGVVHRDLKPENLFLTRDGRTKILDFGLARSAPGASTDAERTLLTVPGGVFGTVPYMAPEQLRGEPVDARTDLYSLGLTLYELASGVLPTRAETPALTIAIILREELPPPSRHRPGLPIRLDHVIQKALQKDPGCRFGSAEEMLEALLSAPEELSGTVDRHSGRGSLSLTSGLNRLAVVPQPGESRLVGRERELALLEDRLAGVRRSRGCCLLVEGDPGLGKTRLLEWTLDRARGAGWGALHGRCSEAEGSLPFLPFVEVLEQLAGTLSEDLLRAMLGPAGPELGRLSPRIRRLLPEGQKPLKVPPEQERFVLFSSLQEFLERVAVQGPLVIGIEDLHWADDLSLRFLEHLASRLRELPILVLGTMRPASIEPGAQSGLDELIRRRHADRIRLTPLERADVAELLREYAPAGIPEAVVGAVYAVTEGNPFFVEEVFRLLTAEHRLTDDSGAWRSDLDLSDLDVPEGIQTLLERRFRRLRPQTVQVLQRAALLGRRFRSDILELAEAPETGPDAVIEALEEAERSGLLSVSSSAGGIICNFSHALVRQALMDGISAWRRQRIHLKIAQAIESGTPGSDAGAAVEIAYHLTRSGSLAKPETCLRYVTLAAEQALERTAFEEAIRLFEQALPLARDPSGRAGLLFRSGLARTGLRDWTTAQQEWRQALHLFEQAGDAEGVGRIASILAAQFMWSGRPLESIEISRRALRTVDETTPAYRCRLLAWMGHGLSQGCETEEGWALTGKALETAEQVGDPELKGHILAHRAYQAFYCGRFREQAETAVQAVELLSSNAWDLAEALAAAAHGLFGAGDLDGADVIGARLAQLAGRIGHLGSLWWYCRVKGGVDFVRTGDLEAFRRFAEEDLAMCRRAGLPWASESCTWLGLVEFWRGNREAALSWFDKAVNLEPRDFTQGFDTAQRLLFLAYCGVVQEPLDECRAVVAAEGQGDATLGRVARLLAAVESASVLERPELSGALYPRVRSVLDSGVNLHFEGTGLVAVTAGIAAAGASHWHQAEEHFRAALSQAETLPHRLGQADARRWYGLCLARQQGPGSPRSRNLLAEASRLYGELGIKGLELRGMEVRGLR
jgi:tetratricopeptide (TPR) repeat protein